MRANRCPSLAKTMGKNEINQEERDPAEVAFQKTKKVIIVEKKISLANIHNYINLSVSVSSWCWQNTCIGPEWSYSPKQCRIPNVDRCPHSPSKQNPQKASLTCHPESISFSAQVCRSHFYSGNNYEVGSYFPPSSSAVVLLVVVTKLLTTLQADKGGNQKSVGSFKIFGRAGC